MMVVYRREKMVDFWADAEALVREHYLEIAQFKDIPLVVDTERYERLEQIDALRIYTARQGSAVIGYCVLIVQSNAHYSTSKQAAQDVLFVDPQFRHGRLAMRLLEFVENELRQEGVQVIYQHSKIAHPALGRLLDHMGYTRADIIHSKRLD